MSGEKKITLELTDEMHSRLGEIADHFAIPATDMHRRAIGLVSIAHSLIEEAGDDVYICKKDANGNLVQLHVVSDLLY